MKIIQLSCAIYLILSMQVTQADTLLFHESFDSLDQMQVNGASAGSAWPNIVPGVVGNAADFSNSTRVCYPLQGNLDLSQGTLEFWVKTPNANRLGFFDIGGLGSANSRGIFKNADHIIMEVKNVSNSFDQAWGPAPIAHDDRWHLVTAVWQIQGTQTNFKVCWDGACKSNYDGIVSGSNPNPAGNFCVGWVGWYGFSRSQIDELKVYDYVKTDLAILEYFNGNTPYDETVPVIDLNGINTQILQIGQPYVLQPVCATDNRDGDISARVVTRGLVDSSVPGSYRLSFNVSDTAGNHATERVRMVYVLDLSADSTSRAFDYLTSTMDQYHTSFHIYTDFNSGANHASPSGWMGYTDILQVDPQWQVNCYSGLTCFKNIWETALPSWVGIRWLQPDSNWANLAAAGFDLSGATKVSFYARGELGNEPVEFVAGGVVGTYPDSLQPEASTGTLSLSTDWTRYEIPLEGLDLTHIVSPFGWLVRNDPIFYIDEVKYDVDRRDRLRFLQSFTILDNKTEFPLLNTAYVYDNALAMLAYIARGSEDDLSRARLLADALVYAQENDRHYNDGRLRNAYMSGDLYDPAPSTAKLPGWWDIQAQQWYEDEFNVSTHTGNVAWAMLALITYYEVSGETRYLESAKRMGDWVEQFTRDDRGAGGYMGGYEGWEQTATNTTPPKKLLYKATEHNIDLYPAFQRLFLITGDDVWRQRAEHAKTLVDSMWNNTEGFFWTGTGDDGVTVNRDNIPVDIQAWAVMAIPDDLRIRRGLVWAKNNCALSRDGFSGFDFNCSELDGVWFEGSAQMALALRMNGDNSSRFYRSEIQKAQTQAVNTDGRGIVAASHDGVTTGFNWEYFSRLHVGATSWYLFAELGYNPYWHQYVPDPVATTSNDGGRTAMEPFLLLLLLSVFVYRRRISGSR
ncbi:MAG: DUF5011 domain-containing protein [Gammaproteobacteria bacterium]|nr:DUF5011 domain-containing protein [Gammaproteobacteria bacterium]MDH5800353.1 DUF5011 domain-containing protein [Gammaproteobacteria bacterium]